MQKLTALAAAALLIGCDQNKGTGRGPSISPALIW